jgi:putative aldouronate transport system permease protein
MGKKFRVSPLTLLNYLSLLLIAGVTLYPFWYVVMYSLSSYQQVLGKGAIIRPYGFTLASIQSVLANPMIGRAYLNTIFIVVMGTVLSIITTAFFAYPLARNVGGAKFLSIFIYITMLFSGGMIPTFYIVRETGLIDSLWSLIIPALISPFYVFIMRNFFRGIPSELIESADVDGASEMRIFLAIILPLSIPVLASISLFYAVMYWNKFFDAIIYIKSVDKRPLQLILREMVTSASTEMFDQMIAGMQGEARQSDVTPTSLKMATVTVAVVPVMCIYPFVQKYFVKGVLLGAVKS